MEGIIWLFLALLVAFVALAVVLAGLRRRPLTIKQTRGRCSNCATPMSMRRVSWLKSLLFLAAWECPHCGNRSRSRKAASPAVS